MAPSQFCPITHNRSPHRLIQAILVYTARHNTRSDVLLGEARGEGLRQLLRLVLVLDDEGVQELHIRDRWGVPQRGRKAGGGAPQKKNHVRRPQTHRGRDATPPATQPIKAAVHT